MEWKPIPRNEELEKALRHIVQSTPDLFMVFALPPWAFVRARDRQIEAARTLAEAEMPCAF